MLFSTKTLCTHKGGLVEADYYASHPDERDRRAMHLEIGGAFTTCLNPGGLCDHRLMILRLVKDCG
jgi:hypothetical protein